MLTHADTTQLFHFIVVKSAESNSNTGQLFSSLYSLKSECMRTNTNTFSKHDIRLVARMMTVNMNRFRLHLTSSTMWIRSCSKVLHSLRSPQLLLFIGIAHTQSSAVRQSVHCAKILGTNLCNSVCSGVPSFPHVCAAFPDSQIYSALLFFVCSLYFACFSLSRCGFQLWAIALSACL